MVNDAWAARREAEPGAGEPGIPARLWRTVRVRGVAGASRHYARRLREAARTLLPAHRRWLSQLAAADREFDSGCGLDTGGLIDPQRLGLPDGTRHFAVSYIASDPEEFQRVMGSVALDRRRFVFIDLGSGKGRAVLMAMREPWRRVIGVEFSPMLHETARRNVALYRQRGGETRCGSVELVRADAAEYQLPEEPLACFLYNPFQGRVLARVVQNIVASFARCPRPIYIFYSHPVQEGLLSREPGLVKVAGGDLFAVYRARRPAGARRLLEPGDEPAAPPPDAGPRGRTRS